jgi:hypothetical protein
MKDRSNDKTAINTNTGRREVFIYTLFNNAVSRSRKYSIKRILDLKGCGRSHDLI